MYINRPLLNDYESTLGPKLILIMDRPLENDKEELFNSTKGLMYLSECFKSKFKSAETHICAVSNIDEKNFSRLTLIPILERYFKKGTLRKNELIFGFVGQAAFDAFKEDYSSSIDSDGRICTLREYNNTIEIFSKEISIKESWHIPYIILPGVNEDYSQIASILDETEISKNIVKSPYCDTRTIINKLNSICDLYNEGILKGFRFNTKINKIAKKTEYFKIYDAFTNIELLYSLSDKICEEDSIEIKEEFKAALKKALTTVPVYSEDIETILSSYKYKDTETKQPLFITPINEEEGSKLNSTRSSFVFRGDESNPNGTRSEWYDKWYKDAYKKYIHDTMDAKQRERDGYNIDHRYEWVYDIEVFKYDWLFVAKSLDKKNTVICWNDADSLREWIKDKILIGFNNSGYDDSVIRHAMAYPYATEDTKTVKEFSDALINDEQVKRYPDFREEYKICKVEHGLCYNSRGEVIPNVTPPNFISWDISLHLPFDIRRNSLKKLTMSVLDKRNYDSSVPFDIQTPLTPSERIDVEKYCEMDVDNTLELFLPKPEDVEAKKENPKYKMREFARDSYDIKWNLIVEYKMKALNLITKSASFAGKVLCGEDAKPNSANTFKIVNNKKQFYAIPELAMKELAGTTLLDFYLKNQDNENYIKEKFEYYMGGEDEGHLYQFGFGGLHQALLGYGSENLVNMDVASLYPSLLIQYGLMSRGAAANPDSYEQVYKTRIEAKHTGKDLLNQGLKLVLNGAIGAMLSAYNPLYDTWSNSTICVHGQLLLFILAKRLFEAGFNIVQTNTDGIMIERQSDVDFMPICEKWMEETRLVLEFDEIAILQQNNVNNYYCQFTNGKVKSKGFYLSNEKFGKATSKILCNIVTHKPLLEGVLPRDFVIYKRHSVGEIYDATTNKKVEGRSLAFVIGKADDPRTQAYYSRSRNEREVVVKDAKGKAMKDENGNNITALTNSISKITGFTDHMLIVDDINKLEMDEINTSEYVNFAKNLLNRKEVFGPYYDINYTKVEEPAYLQALNPLKDNTDLYPTKAGVVSQNFLFECDYLSREEQEELIKKIEQYTYRIVWSGHRSYHIVVRLNKPVTSTAYKKIWYYLAYNLGLQNADEQCAQPSRYTRTPDQENPKTGELQTLYSENKYEFDVESILDNLPKLKEELKQPTQYKGQVTIKALERHIKRQDWGEGNRFAACQKLSPILISQVPLNELLEMIPCKLEKDHIYVLKAKYHYWNKYKHMYEESGNTQEEY